LYFVPRNLGIKAEILACLGDRKASNELYEKSAELLNALLSKLPMPTVEGQLLDDLSIVYAGYFVSLCDQGRTEDAFRAIELPLLATGHQSENESPRNYPTQSPTTITVFD
jgi:hypothetical protein